MINNAESRAEIAAHLHRKFPGSNKEFISRSLHDPSQLFMFLRVVVPKKDIELYPGSKEFCDGICLSVDPKKAEKEIKCVNTKGSVSQSTYLEMKNLIRESVEVAADIQTDITMLHFGEEMENRGQTKDSVKIMIKLRKYMAALCVPLVSNITAAADESGSFTYAKVLEPVLGAFQESFPKYRIFFIAIELPENGAEKDPEATDISLIGESEDLSELVCAL